MLAPGGSERPPPLALLAGGLATRLRPTTIAIPKSMIEVAGEAFIAHQLRLLARQGITDIVVCAGHLGEQIEAYVGDGGTFGCNVRYSFDGDTLLGTGGALRKALPLLGDRFFVMYGDSYLPTPFSAIRQAFERAGLPALMTVFRNAGRWDASNVEFVNGVICRYDKVDRTPAMLHIDYGLGILAAGVVHDWAANRTFDLAELYRDLARRGLLAGFEVHERFYEIGSPAGITETDGFLRQRAPGAGS
jgi:N-acetyl-alpha-D-muramate 1-phosphate uridylyltransferase